MAEWLLVCESVSIFSFTARKTNHSNAIAGCFNKRSKNLRKTDCLTQETRLAATLRGRRLREQRRVSVVRKMGREQETTILLPTIESDPQCSKPK